MAALSNLVVGIRVALAEWMRLKWGDLQFAQGRVAFFVFIVLLALVALVLLGRQLSSRKAGRTHVALPALLPTMRRSRLSVARHSPFLIFLLGVPFFGVALADPRTSFRHDDVSYPGRRIVLVIDASGSMIMKFQTSKLKTQATPAYYTAVAGAERFMRLRMAGPYHDLIALVQFGDQAYVMTPFTTDYENVLLSLSLISNPREWGRFPEFGTTMLRMVWSGPSDVEDEAGDATPLSAHHASAALELAELTRPGPFAIRTIELGDYFGYFDNGRLVAMAGERFFSWPFREVSGVCTHPSAQGRGLAKRLMSKLLHLELERGEIPFLHVVTSNTVACTLYERIGFESSENLRFGL